MKPEFLLATSAFSGLNLLALRIPEFPASQDLFLLPVRPHSRNYDGNKLPLSSVSGNMAHDLRFALRMILSHRLFSAAVVATLALGIGLNTMVFTLVNAVLFKPVPVPGGEQLVSILNQNLKQRTNNTMRVSYPDFRDYRAQ
ncbi:MAG: hypothetical protein WA714_16530, partial [Candidatus Acidiferrales bacterium]